MIKYETLSTNELVQLAKENHNGAINYIIKKYKGVIHGRIKKKSYFLQGGDYEDLLQEGMIGLYKAIRDFKEDSGEFDVFSKICIDRQLISAIKTSTRKKHAPLNEMISLDRSLPENDNLNMMDIFGAREDVRYGIDLEYLSPEEQVILKETYEIQKRILEESLSPREKAVFDRYLDDQTYKEIMEDLNVDTAKTIDNALQRVKRKIDRAQAHAFADLKREES